MKVFIVEVTVPDSWTRHDVVSAVNIGLNGHYVDHAQSGGERKLESPRGLTSNAIVLADYRCGTREGLTV